MKFNALAVSIILLFGTYAQAETAPVKERSRLSVALIPLTGVLTSGGGQMLSPAVVEIGVHGFRSPRTSFYAGIGFGTLPLLALGGAMINQNWFDERLNSGRFRVNGAYLPKGDLQSGPEFLAGLRWQPSGVLRTPTLLKDQGAVNANSLLLEIGVGWCLAMQRRLVHIVPTILLGGTRFNVLDSSSSLGWQWSAGFELAVRVGG